MVDENGEGLRVYDIGSVPQRIIDTGEYVYILTSTRLYVLRTDSLHALIDTLDGGNLVVAKSGFGLLEKKRLRWFDKEGGLLGSILSKDPGIRDQPVSISVARASAVEICSDVLAM